MKSLFMPDLNTTFAHQINAAQRQAMCDDPTMLSFGLGIDDPAGIFGTTKGLVDEFGNDRVFDMPTSENAMTGVGIGAAIAGSRVLMTHQRFDFFLLAIDQLVNNAAKWHYMFNGQMSVPLTIRLIIGRGWGQGPTHAQNLQSWFTHIPGLKVIVPSKTEAVANQLYQAIMDNNPVVFLEHRWLHQQKCGVNDVIPVLSSSELLKTYKVGNDITLIANSYMLLEAIKAAELLSEHGVSCEVLDIVQVNPIEWDIIYASIRKTGHCLVCDCGHLTSSFSAEVICRIAENCFSSLKVAPKRLALPDHPEPTSFGLTKEFYNDANDIVDSVSSILQLRIIEKTIINDEFHDVPGSWFKGPF